MKDKEYEFKNDTRRSKPTKTGRVFTPSNKKYHFHFLLYKNS